MKRFIAIITTIIFLSSNVLAAGSSASGKIIQMYVGTGYTMVKMQGVTDNPDSCNGVSMYALDTNENNYEARHSTLLASMFAEKTVSFRLQDCAMGVPLINAIFVDN